MIKYCSKKFGNMPLTNDVIIRLNEITTLVENKNKLKSEDIDMIKNIFKEILKNGQIYDVDDIESWFINEGSWHDKNAIGRITNLSHYIQNKHEQQNPFKIISDSHE